MPSPAGFKLRHSFITRKFAAVRIACMLAEEIVHKNLMEKEIFIIALLSYVKPLGYVVLPYSCFRDNDKFITVHERLSGLNIGKYP